MSGKWSLRVLGPFQILKNPNNSAISVSSKKARALLLLLATEPDRGLTRSRIIGLLWPDRDEALARQSLRQVLSDLRRDLGPTASSLITTTDDVIALGNDVETDLHHLDSEPSTTEHLENAVQSYHGEFGHGLEQGVGEFDDWLVFERERYRNLAIQCFTKLIDRLTASQQLQKAHGYSLGLYTLDPFREESHRKLIELEAKTAGRASAITRYETIKRNLEQELSVTPEPETEALIKRIKGGTDHPVAPDPRESEESAPVMEKVYQSNKYKRPLMLYALASTLVMLVCVTAAIAVLKARPIEYIAEKDGRISVALIPFKSKINGDLKVEISDLQEDVYQQLLAIRNLAVVQSSSDSDEADLAGRGRLLKARYVLAANISGSVGQDHLNIRLFESQTGDAVLTSIISLGPVSDAGHRKNIANQLARTVYKDVFLDRARRIETTDDSTAALLVRGEAAALRGRFVSQDNDERSIYQRVLERDSDNALALRGLARYLVLAVAMEKSSNRQQDLSLAVSTLEKLNRIYPNNSTGIFLTAMIEKLNFRFEQALHGFNRAIELETTFPQAQVHRSHLMALMGRPEEAFPIMLEAMNQSPKDFTIASTAYIAAETALLANQDEQAVSWLRLAVQENPAAARSHALLSAALELTGRSDEAVQAAQTSRNLNPAYTPDVMRRRFGGAARSSYRERQARFVSAFDVAFRKTKRSAKEL